MKSYLKFLSRNKLYEVAQWKRTSDKRELHWARIMFRATPRFLQFQR